MPYDRILVVDDEETIREIVSSMLEGCEFSDSPGCERRRSALAILESGDEFDLVLSDLMMAEMDGIALLEHSKERFPTCRSSWSPRSTTSPSPCRPCAMAPTTTC